MSETTITRDGNKSLSTSTSDYGKPSALKAGRKSKAVKGDREKCLDAGFSDYIAKPVNTDQLLSLMRVWLFR